MVFTCLDAHRDLPFQEVPSGPFCSRRSETCDGRWPIPVELDGPALKREVRANGEG